jgi:hypothetical protein
MISGSKKEEKVTKAVSFLKDQWIKEKEKVLKVVSFVNDHWIKERRES